MEKINYVLMALYSALYSTLYTVADIIGYVADWIFEKHEVLAEVQYNREVTEFYEGGAE